MIGFQAQVTSTVSEKKTQMGFDCLFTLSRSIRMTLMQSFKQAHVSID